MTDRYIPYGRQWIDDQDIQAVVEALGGDWLTQGPSVERFERALADYCHAKYAVAVSNGTVALHLACLAADLGLEAEGITSPITFLASATSMVYCGATPRFADIDEATWTMDPSSTEGLINSRTKVLIPVDFGGLPCDLRAFRSLADKNDLVVIEDACHSIGGSYSGTPIGGTEHADMVCFSFHPVKAMTTGEGGAIVTNDQVLDARLRRLRHHGMTKDPTELRRNDGPWYYELHQPGLNGRLTDIQSALGLSQLSKLDGFIERRRQIAEAYREAFSDLPGVTLQAEPADRQSAYHLFAIHLDPAVYDRLEVFEKLAKRKIGCQVHYVPVHMQPFFEDTYGSKQGDCPKAEHYYQGCLSLPMFPALSDEDLQRVIDAVSSVCAGV